MTRSAIRMIELIETSGDPRRWSDGIAAHGATRPALGGTDLLRTGFDVDRAGCAAEPVWDGRVERAAAVVDAWLASEPDPHGPSAGNVAAIGWLDARRATAETGA